jgi:hypothetical protein
MNFRKQLLFTFSLSISFLFFTIIPAFAEDSGLVGLLTSKLGVTGEQATGGAGAIFKMAKEKLNADDFGKIAAVVPGVDKLVKAAPATEEKKGWGSAIGKFSEISSLAGSFSKLGLSADMVGKFTGIILPFVQSKGGDTVMNLLKGALKS